LNNKILLCLAENKYNFYCLSILQHNGISSTQIGKFSQRFVENGAPGGAVG
jgi:hypothetical protein